MLSERREWVLKVLIDEYITTAVPVGSEAIVRKYSLGVSPATIRNEMAYLEGEGYITHPHTSSGRIPAEKGYRYYTADVTQMETPLEGGLGFCVDWAKPGFIGKDALAAQKQAGLTRKLCTLTIDGEGFRLLYGGEAISRDRAVLGRVRSGGWGYTVGKNILLAYLPIALAKPGERVEVELLDGPATATVGPTALHDPKGARLRG